MLNEAKISRPRSRPRSGPWGRSRSFEVKAEAKDKVMNKKYQMMVDTRRIYIIMIKTTQFNFSFSLAQ